MKKSNIDKLIELVNICFYYDGLPLDSTIMEKLNDAGEFEDGFVNIQYEGAPYGIEIKNGSRVTLNAHDYVVAEVQFAYFNQDNGVFPLNIKVFLKDE